MNVSPAGPRASHARNDDILVAIMNPTAAPEASALARNSAGAGIQVLTVADQPRSASANVNGQRLDLGSAAGVQRFVATLGLPPGQQQQVESVLSGAAKDSRDVLAGIAQAWAPAERGESRAPSRMLISGHHVGRGVFGAGAPLAWHDLQALAHAMPVAAAQVEDLNVSGCYSGGQHLRETYESIFPRLETVWAYTLQAPSTHRGALPQQKAWEQQTRGPGASSGQTVQALRASGGDPLRSAQFYATTAPSFARPLQPLRAALQQQEGLCQEFLSGRRKPEHAQYGPLRAYYNKVQELLQQTGVPPQERAHWEARRDKVIAILGRAPH